MFEVESMPGTNWAWSDINRGHQIYFNPYSFGDPEPQSHFGSYGEARPDVCRACAEHKAWVEAQKLNGPVPHYKFGMTLGEIADAEGGSIHIVDVIEGNLKKVELSESQRRKNTPVTTGVLDYFPDAIRAIARISKFGNDKHNPGEPLHWARDKSTDHADCVGRHLIDRGQIDPETGESHTVELAWRSLALLQIEEEERLKALK